MTAKINNAAVSASTDFLSIRIERPRELANAAKPGRQAGHFGRRATAIAGTVVRALRHPVERGAELLSNLGRSLAARVAFDAQQLSPGRGLLLGVQGTSKHTFG